MLAQPRRAPLQRQRLAVGQPGQPHQRHAIAGDEGSAFLRDRPAHRLLEAAHPRRRHAGRSEAGDPAVRVGCCQHRFDLRLQLAPVAAARRDVGKARVVGPGAAVQHGQHRQPQPLAGRGHQQVGVARAVALVRRGDRVARAGARRPLAADARGAGLIGHDTESRIHQRRLQAVHRLARAPCQQCGHDPHRHPLAGAEVDDRWRAACRRGIVMAGHLHDPAEGLHQRIVAGHR